MRFGTIAALAASVAVAAAQDQKYLGFNSGAETDAKKIKKEADFEAEFTAAQKLQNSPGTFNSVRLYTNIQPNTTDSPIEAFAAAMTTKTKILLGMWTSGTQDITNELNALTKAIEQHGKEFTDLVIGISVGSEDLYRVSVDGVKNSDNPGQESNTIVGFIKDTRDKLKGTALSKTPVGHVDTWTAWANSSNKAVIDEVDFAGVNAFPYYENGINIKMTNEIDNAADLFQAALDATKKALGDKPLWITETGWPTKGPKENQAVPSVENAKKYWDDVGCTLFNKTNTFWYILRDSNAENKMKFGINPELDGTPKFDLTCPEKTATPTPSTSTKPTGTPRSDESNQSNESNRSNDNNESQPTQTPSSANVARLNMVALGLLMVLAVAAGMA